jgi:general secretion pathway protein G
MKHRGFSPSGSKKSLDRKPSFYRFFHTFVRRRATMGFTMIEVLVAMTLVGIMSAAGVVALQSTQVKARDAQRKGHLEKIRTAFEDYYNDNDCYPPAGALATCQGTSLRPYLDEVPCDPLTGEAYLYNPLSNRCSGYRVHAGLENTQDDSIARLNCDTDEGCGYDPGLNYGVSAGVPVADPTGVLTGGEDDGESSPTPTPPSGPIYVYACDSAGVCNQFQEGHPFLVNCPVTFPASNCNNECGNTALRCGG